jgi:hypothetical protein
LAAIVFFCAKYRAGFSITVTRKADLLAAAHARGRVLSIIGRQPAD